MVALILHHKLKVRFLRYQLALKSERVTHVWNVDNDLCRGFRWLD
jgi:hypothetical protein